MKYVSFFYKCLNIIEIRIIAYLLFFKKIITIWSYFVYCASLYFFKPHFKKSQFKAILCIVFFCSSHCQHFQLDFLVLYQDNLFRFSNADTALASKCSLFLNGFKLRSQDDMEHVDANFDPYQFGSVDCTFVFTLLNRYLSWLWFLKGRTQMTVRLRNMIKYW